MKAKHPERAERLREFLNRLNIKNVTLASKLGIKPAFVSQLLNQHSTVTADVALRIARVYPKLNVTWLLDGVGEMLLEKKEGDAEAPTGVMEPESPAYERSARQGVLEEALSRLSALEDKVVEMEERLRAVESGGKKE